MKIKLNIYKKTQLIIVLWIISIIWSQSTIWYSNNINSSKDCIHCEILDNDIKPYLLINAKIQELGLIELEQLTTLKEIKKEIKKRKKLHRFIVEKYNEDLTNNNFLFLLIKSQEEISMLEKIKKEKKN